MIFHRTLKISLQKTLSFLRCASRTLAKSASTAKYGLAIQFGIDRLTTILNMSLISIQGVVVTHLMKTCRRLVRSNKRITRRDCVSGRKRISNTRLLGLLGNSFCQSKSKVLSFLNAYYWWILLGSRKCIWV